MRRAPRDDPKGSYHHASRVHDAAAIARLDKDLDSLPERLTTRSSASEASRSLAGKNERTALARAIATDPAILVLDDALSAVDTYTEEEILPDCGRSCGSGRL